MAPGIVLAVSIATGTMAMGAISGGSTE